VSPNHVPIGNPCQQCGRHAAVHRVNHRPIGSPCSICGLLTNNHRYDRKEKRKHNKQGKGSKRSKRGKHNKKTPESTSTKKWVYLGIDGEGQGRKYHKYIFLACASEDQSFRASVRNPDGLTTEQCLNFIISLPRHRHKLFAYAFSYDLTKILTDVDNETLYKLFRPELRKRPDPKNERLGPYYMPWRGFRLNYQAAKFTIIKGKRRVVIWDIFKFFQGKFVNAIKDWKVGNTELWERMQKMKDQREHFDKLAYQEVQEYCFEECACMAELARKLTEAHIAAGLKLKSYYGAGSSASAMLDVMGIKEHLDSARSTGDSQLHDNRELQHAVSSAFFGGRFENSIVGAAKKTVFSYDISSAYPYQLFFLPCLKHGMWELSSVRRDLEGSEVVSAIVHYQLDPKVKTDERYNSWAPFPFRTEDGAICFPRNSGGGWVYLDEYRSGERLFPYVRFVEAWIYKCTCDCRPFAKIPAYYEERVRIGKEGPGIVIKLGCNSCYGKLAQSVGNAPYNSWLWAGMITSGTRAQFLDVLGLHQDMRNCLMVATDGTSSLERIACPIPRDTGTFQVFDERDKVHKPLGGWEEKVINRGVFLARPGIYFPLQPTAKELKDVRGRGVGKSVILQNYERIETAWNEISRNADYTKTIDVQNVSRFCGVKSSISVSGHDELRRYRRAAGEATEIGERPSYGQWIVRKVEMSFDPLPKRKCVEKDGRTLRLRRLPVDVESTPYDRAVKSKEGLALAALELEVLEQPEGDLVEYGVGEGGEEVVW
jgi:hypothetical protein